MKSCPLQLSANKEYWRNCNKENCSFWDEQWNRCAVLSIAKALDSVAELSRGERTLYTREI